MPRLLHFTAALALMTAPLHADEISDALNNALEAYQDGDIGYALEELEYAKQLMAELKTEELVQFLPDAPDGWSREVNTEMNAGLVMMGGGVGAEADYDKADGSDSFTLTLMADNPMVGAMAGLLSNATAIGAKIQRVGREKFMLQNGELTGLVDNRILVKATGADPDAMLAVLEMIDYRALSDFGR